MTATPCQDCGGVPADCMVFPADEIGSRVVCLSCRASYVDEEEFGEDDQDQFIEGQTAFAYDEGLIE